VSFKCLGLWLFWSLLAWAYFARSAVVCAIVLKVWLDGSGCVYFVCLLRAVNSIWFSFGLLVVRLDGLVLFLLGGFLFGVKWVGSRCLASLRAGESGNFQCVVVCFWYFLPWLLLSRANLADPERRYHVRI